MLNAESMKPIYVQIAEYLEGEILKGSLGADEKVYSQYQLAEMFNINPATAAKGISLLAEEGILYKKRGLGMFVAPHGREHILEKQRTVVLNDMILELVHKAEQLGVEESDLIARIQRIRKQEGGSS